MEFYHFIIIFIWKLAYISAPKKSFILLSAEEWKFVCSSVAWSNLVNPCGEYIVGFKQEGLEEYNIVIRDAWYQTYTANW